LAAVARKTSSALDGAPAAGSHGLLALLDGLDVAGDAGSADRSEDARRLIADRVTR
jgi:hypothetical protein